MIPTYLILTFFVISCALLDHFLFKRQHIWFSLFWISLSNGISISQKSLFRWQIMVNFDLSWVVWWIIEQKSFAALKFYRWRTYYSFFISFLKVWCLKVILTSSRTFEITQACVNNTFKYTLRSRGVSSQIFLRWIWIWLQNLCSTAEFLDIIT